MLRWTMAALPALGLLLAVPRPGPACSLCGGNLRQKPTFREDAAQPTARIVLIGTVKETAVNPRDGSGSTVLAVKALLRSDPALKGKDVVTVPRYLDPGDRKDPSQYLVFCDESDRKSTRLNSSHLVISYAVFCLKKKKKTNKSNTSNTYTELTDLQ